VEAKIDQLRYAAANFLFCFSLPLFLHMLFSLFFLSIGTLDPGVFVPILIMSALMFFMIFALYLVFATDHHMFREAVILLPENAQVPSVVLGIDIRHPGFLVLLRASMAILVMFVGFVYLYAFSAGIHDRIPEQFGGGKSREAYLVISESSGSFRAALGAESASEPPIRRVDLLWETDQMYVVRDNAQPDSPIIQIDRDAVSAIVLGSRTTSGAVETVPAASPVAAP